MEEKDKKTEESNENDNGSLGYCSDPQFSPDHNINWHQTDHNSAIWIDFTEQPADFRYRYLKEKYHGHIVGKSSPATKKKDLCKFPKLKLFNYNGSAIVRVWLISPQLLDKPCAHFHKLARKPPKGELNLEPHDFRASEENNYEITLDYLHIVHAVSSDENDINLYRKKKAHIDSGLFDPPRSIPPSSKDEKEEIKQIDKNQSHFYIQVFDENSHNMICQPIVSNKIKNLHNAETGALKIVNCSRTFGTCRGGDEVFIFVEKISKDVQVRFFQLKNNNSNNNNKKERLWQELAIFGPQHVHHQLGIVFRTPKFKEDIEKDVPVFFELHRTNDGAVSEAYPFTYKPHEHYKCNDMAKKRPHSPEIITEDDLPVVVSSFNSKRIKDESMSPDSTTLHPIIAETVQLENTIYSSYTIPQTNDVELSRTSLWNSIDSNALSLNTTSVDYTNNGPWQDIYYPDTSSDDIINQLFEKTFPEFDLQIQTDSVSSTYDVDKDEDKDLLSHKHGDFNVKPVSANECNPEPVDLTKSKIRNGRKSPHSKVDLLSAIYLKKPFEEFNEVLKRTVDINAVDYEGNTALHYAVRSSLEYLKPILERDDIDRRLKNLWGDDALLDAARNDDIDSVRFLLGKDFEPNVQNSRTGETPLHLAVSNKNCQMIGLLLQHGANPLLDNYSDKSAYEYLTDCNIKLRRLMSYMMQKSMFQKRKSACLNKTSHSPENDLVSKLNELTVSTS